MENICIFPLNEPDANNSIAHLKGYNSYDIFNISSNIMNVFSINSSYSVFFQIVSKNQEWSQST